MVIKSGFSVVRSTHSDVMNWRSSVAAPLLLMMLFLTSCVAPIAAPVPANNAKKARYVAELEPPSQYNHPYYDGPVEERVLPVAEVRVLCDSLGASHSSADASAPGGTVDSRPRRDWPKLRNSSGGLAILAAIRRALSFL